MPFDEPSTASIATTAAFGAASGGLIAVSKPMTRREVFYNLLGGTILAASVPQVVEFYFGIHPVARSLLGVACGLSVPVIIGVVQSVTERVARYKAKDITDRYTDHGGSQ